MSAEEREPPGPAWARRLRAGLSPASLLGLTLAALLLRLAACLATGAFDPPAGRWSHGYEVGAVAVALAEGRGFSDPFLSRTGPSAAVGPALPFLWSLLVHAFGPYSAGAHAGFVLLNVLFSTLLVPLVHALGRRCGGPVVGLLAATVWALHPVGVLGPTVYQSSSGLFALFVTATLERLVALEQAEAHVQAKAPVEVQAAGGGLRALILGTGALIGAGLWVEPLLLPVLACWLGWALLRRRFALVRAGLLACALAALIVLPWVLRNALVFEAPVFLRSWAGPELLLGAVAGPGEPTPVHLHPTRSGAEMRELMRLGEERYAHEKARQAMELIRQRPARWVAAVTWRWGAFWLGRASWWRSAPDHPVAAGWGSRARGAVHLVPTLLAALGLWRMRRRTPEAVRVLLIAFLSYPLTYGLTHVEARYRHPLEAALTVACVLALLRADMLVRPRAQEES